MLSKLTSSSQSLMSSFLRVIIASICAVRCWGLHMQGARKLPFPLRCGSPSLQGDCSADEGQKFCLRKASGLHQRAQESLWHVDPAAARRREGVAGSKSGNREARASQSHNLFLWFPNIVLASFCSKSKSLMILLSKANK